MRKLSNVEDKDQSKQKTRQNKKPTWRKQTMQEQNAFKTIVISILRGTRKILHSRSKNRILQKGALRKQKVFLKL